jgi:hypothetical protein
MSNTQPLLYRPYKQKKNQWDDPLDTEIYLLPIEEDRDNLYCYRYEVSKRDKSLAVFSTLKVSVEAQWFLEYHQLIEGNEGKILLRSMLDTVLDQVREANNQAVLMNAFYRRFKNVVDKSGAL